MVRLEKGADYLISDHARNDAPPGSYSWKFIDDSLQAGALQPMEKYLCANPQVRPVGSSVPSKGTRTAFTPEDDEILSAWVKKHTQMRLGISGNVIYKKLELEVRCGLSWLSLCDATNLCSTLTIPGNHGRTDQSMWCSSWIRLQLPPPCLMKTPCTHHHHQLKKQVTKLSHSTLPNRPPNMRPHLEEGTSLPRTTTRHYSSIWPNAKARISPSLAEKYTTISLKMFVPHVPISYHILLLI